VSNSPNSPKDSVEFRRRAEARLCEKQKRHAAEGGNQRSEADTSQLLHELEVHQIELEMQNEELREARDKTEALLEKYTDLYDFAPVGYLTHNPAGNIHEANLTASKMLKTTRSMLINRRFGQFISAMDVPAFDIFRQDLFTNQVRHICEVALNVGGGAPLPVQLEGITFEAGQACRITLTDITELKQAEADRLILNKLESTGILAGGIAHDFNNLLTIILLNIEMAQMINPAADGPVRYLEEAKKFGFLARDLTAQLVTFSDGGTPVRKPMFLAELIKKSVQPALSSFNVRCDFSLAEDLWAVEVDAGQMGQVIRNVVLNACEATPPNGLIVVRAQNVLLRALEQASLPAGEYVRVSITDQGLGISKDALPKIFDPYFSTKQRGTQKGMGLGLTICHSVLQKHKGAITVESMVGSGTTFHIYLPAGRKLSGAEAAPAGAFRAGKVLVMEDEEALREAMASTLSRIGHTVELAENGEQAIELCQTAKQLNRRFDVAILDLAVREGMGAQPAIQALLKIDPNVKGIVMSGNIGDPVMLQPERHGFMRALPKPFDGRKLREILSGVMGSSSEGNAAP
jgi:signal transduction histidine kinase/ActR/RegA family two-component response regulator